MIMSIMAKQQGYVQSIALLLSALFFTALLQSRVRAVWQNDLHALKRNQLINTIHLYKEHNAIVDQLPTTAYSESQTLDRFISETGLAIRHNIRRLEIISHVDTNGVDEAANPTRINAIIIHRCSLYKNDGDQSGNTYVSPMPCSEWRYRVKNSEDGDELSEEIVLEYRVDYKR